MDLIYTNANKEDQGVLFDYEFDLAFGEDENDFSCTVALENHCIEPGAFLYIEGTEYGGIVDSIKVDTEQKTVTYLGRTWHGILEGAVICPFKGTIETQIQKEVEVDKSILPQGYQEVEYIQSSGTQYIDTGFKPNQNTRVVMDAQIVTAPATHLALFGVRNSTNSTANGQYVFGWAGHSSPANFRSDYATQRLTFPVGPVVTDRHIFDKNGAVCSIDNVSVTNTSGTFACTYSAYLLANNDAGTAKQFTSAKLYSCKIYDNGALVRDFIPCKNPSNVVGLYDLATNTFYGNSGTGIFNAGPDVIRKETIIVTETIKKDVNYDHYFANGEGNVVLSELIGYLGLSNIFTASTENSGIQITNYPFRYVDAYSGICKMLAVFDGKLKMKHVLDKVVLYTEPFVDFSQDEEFDSSQVDFTVQKNFRPVNHLVCLGQGDLKDRHVIHLFTDDCGGVQPYKIKGNPVEDADYILDTSKKLLTGIDEVTDILDMPNAQTTENFVKMSVQPEDWSKNYASYFTQDKDGNYVSVHGIPSEEIVPLTTKPSDWAENYAGYYCYIEGEIRSVEAVTHELYVEQHNKPIDWEQNYGNYFTLHSDGVSEKYVPVSGERKTKYIVQTRKPTDWATNFGQYFRRDITGKYFNVRAEEGKAPFWMEKWYFTAETYGTAPEWDGRETYYFMRKTVSTPSFVSGKYYSKKDVLLTPSFLSDATFKKVLDHFKVLVESGLERLKKSMNCDKISIDLELEGEYDIGDIVGASEHITGLSSWQPITKKIVTIKNGRTSISYKVGD